MALSISGLSTRIYNNWTGNSNAGFSSPLSTAQQANIKALCDAVAQAIVDEIHANAAVTVTGVAVGVATVNNGTIS